MQREFSCLQLGVICNDGSSCSPDVTAVHPCPAGAIILFFLMPLNCKGPGKRLSKVLASKMQCIICLIWGSSSSGLLRALNQKL